MVQRSMLLEVLVHTVLVATKHACNGFTSVWIIGVCFFRLNFGLVILPQNLQGKASLLLDQWSMLFQVGLHTGHVDTKLADEGFSPVWLSGVCSFRLGFKLTMSSTFSLVFSTVSLLPKYPHSLTQFPPQFQPFPPFFCP